MHISVALALVNKDRVLLQLRDNKPTIISPNVWCIPSGSLEGQETIVDAVTREFLEETGYRLHSPQWYAFHSEWLENMWIKRYFFVEQYDEKQQIHCYEGQKMEFLSLPELEQISLYRNEDIFIRSAIRTITTI